jgi:uncharacterized membrane protein YgcG
MDERETLLGQSSVYLFGRQLSDLSIDANYQYGPPRSGNNKFLRNQLIAEDARMARIFAFSYEGCFVELFRPIVFLVHGAGLDPDDPPPRNAANEIAYERLSRGPGASARTGLGWQSGAFAKDMRVWIYDKGDFSVRMDVETGTFEHILLEAELDGDVWGSEGRSGSGRSGSGRSGSGRSGSGRSGSGRSGSGRSGS